jgi:seryl-tRNA synthetase
MREKSTMDPKKHPEERIDKWKDRFNDLVNSAQVEIKRTAEIGRKMLSASKTNSSLVDSYQALGRLIYKDIKENRLKLDSVKVKTLVESIDSLTNQLEDFEQDVQKIKKRGQDVDQRP